MPSEREKMETWSQRQVADSLSNAEPGTLAHGRALAELQRREIEIQRSSLASQQASGASADSAARSARLSAWCAILGIVVAVFSLLWSVLHK
jgi:hypothetical protein